MIAHKSYTLGIYLHNIVFVCFLQLDGKCFSNYKLLEILVQGVAECCGFVELLINLS